MKRRNVAPNKPAMEESQQQILLQSQAPSKQYRRKKPFRRKKHAIYAATVFLLLIVVAVTMTLHNSITRRKSDHNSGSVEQQQKASILSTCPDPFSLLTSNDNHYYLKKSSSSVIDNIEVIPIYYINLDKSTDRRDGMEQQLEALPKELSSQVQLQRISAVSTTDVETMVNQGTLILNNGVTQLTYTKRNKYSVGQYTYNEAACTMSHLRAIHQAYQDGHDVVMIVEDDAVLSAEFLQHWKLYAKQAPKDWNLLQWTTNNDVVNQRELHKRHDYWVAWKPYYYSTIAYTIRREGMKHILDQTALQKKHTTNGTAIVADQKIWEFHEPDMLSADELIYYLAQKTYTSTYPWISGRNYPTTMGDYHLGNFERDFTFGKSSTLPVIDENQQTRSEKIAVVMSCRLKDEQDIVDEIARIKMDIEALQTSNPQSRWFLNVVLVQEDLIPVFERHAKTSLPLSLIDMYLQVNDQRFNKFVFVNCVLDKFTAFDYVLLKDNDIPIAGFEWNTFLELKGDAIVAGPFREQVEDEMYRNRFIRKDSSRRANFQHSVVFNRFPEKTTFQQLTPIPTMSLEMFFSVMKSDFAIWFFRQILTDQFLTQPSCWGPDLMWCGAAHEFVHNQSMSSSLSTSPCLLVPVNILDADTKQIVKTDSQFKLQGHGAVREFQNNSTTFARWIEASSIVRPGTYRMRRVICRCAILSFTVESGECGIATAQRAVDGVEDMVTNPSSTLVSLFLQSTSKIVCDWL